jgi:hypothetical protein
MQRLNGSARFARDTMYKPHSEPLDQFTPPKGRHHAAIRIFMTNLLEPARSQQSGDVLANGVSLRNHGRLRSRISICGSTMCSNRISSVPRPAIAAVNELGDRKGEKRTRGNKIPFFLRNSNWWEGPSGT